MRYMSKMRRFSCTDVRSSTYAAKQRAVCISGPMVRHADYCCIVFSHENRYFTPHKIPSHGTFIDGGLSDNNPSMLALQELRRMAPELSRPDQFVSIGTGSCSAPSRSSSER